MIDQLRQLAIFAKTIDHGSFRGAAGDLHLSPSVVSHHISQLEAHLGVALLYRTTRKLSLTPDGERLLSATRNMLAAVEGELADISSTGDAPSGELRITVPSLLAQSKFTDAIAAFAVEHPRVRLFMNYTDERKELLENGLDVAFRMSVKGQDSRTSRVLFEVERRLMGAASYVASRPVANSPTDVADWDWLSLSPVHNRGLSFEQSDKRRVKIKPNTKVTSNDAQSLYSLTKAGVGIAALPRFLATTEIADGSTVCVLPDWKLDPLKIYAEWPSNAPREGLIKRFVDHLSDELKGI